MVFPFMTKSSRVDRISFVPSWSAPKKTSRYVGVSQTRSVGNAYRIGSPAEVVGEVEPPTHVVEPDAQPSMSGVHHVPVVSSARPLREHGR